MMEHANHCARIVCLVNQNQAIIYTEYTKGSMESLGQMPHNLHDYFAKNSQLLHNLLYLVFYYF